MNQTVKQIYISMHYNPHYTKVIQEIIDLTIEIKKRNRYPAWSV